MTIEQKIGDDLAKIDLIEALGTKSAKLAARKHRAACYAELARMNKADGLDALTDDELLEELIG